jgi:hypothetical protein
LNWYKTFQKRSLEEALSEIKGILFALKYIEPDVDVKSLNYEQLVVLFEKHGLIPKNMTTERFVSAVQFYLRTTDKEWEDIKEQGWD